MLKAAEPGPLFWRQVPGVLEPDVPTVFHEVLMFFAFRDTLYIRFVKRVDLVFICSFLNAHKLELAK